MKTTAVHHEEGKLTGAGGLKLFTQAWLPDSDPTAVVVLDHGASEHSGRYDWVGGELATRGLALFALDHRGHGRSEGPRALVDRMDNVVADLDLLVDEPAARFAGKPLFLLGHSMGGAVALSYAIRHQDRLDGLILSPPLAALEAASPSTRIAGRVLSVIAPKLGVYQVDSTAVSRDPAVVRDYDADPLNYHGKLPARTVAELANAIERYPDEVAGLDLPILVMHGTADRITPIAGSEMVKERAGSSDVTFTRYDGLYHEILNEPERERVLNEIANWIAARTTAGAPSPTGR